MTTIRRARPEDAATLYRAESETSRTPGLLISAPEELSENSFNEKTRWLNEVGIYVVAEIDGYPAGHAFLEPGALRAMAHVFSLTIVVHPGNTGRGIGTALMKFLLAWAAEHHEVEKIELRVREINLVAKRLSRQLANAVRCTSLPSQLQTHTSSMRKTSLMPRYWLILRRLTGLVRMRPAP